MWICEKNGHCVDECDDCQHYIEVEQIVRCKDCKHWEGFAYPDNDGVCHNVDKYYYIYPNENDFCSRGERKER